MTVGLAQAKACPWCRGKRLWWWHKTPGLMAVACSNPNCTCSGPVGRSAEEAVLHWNAAPRLDRQPVLPGLRSPRQLERVIAEMHPPEAETEA